MNFDAEKHHRRTIRLRGFDYSQAGIYFLTLCTHKRECLFGAVYGETIFLNSYGEIVEEEWLKTPGIRPTVELDAFVVMPNHFHAIVVVHDQAEMAHGRAALQEG